MGKNVQFPDKTLAEFRQIIALRVEALNHALAGIPPEHVRHHICWGNGEGPHHKDVALKDIIDILLQAQGRGALRGRGESAPRPRVESVQGGAAPRGHGRDRWRD